MFCAANDLQSCLSLKAEVLWLLQARYERHHGCAYMHDALQAAVTLSARYVADRFLPDKVRVARGVEVP